jgi:hypothetical protein
LIGRERALGMSFDGEDDDDPRPPHWSVPIILAIVAAGLIALALYSMRR